MSQAHKTPCQDPNCPQLLCAPIDRDKVSESDRLRARVAELEADLASERIISQEVVELHTQVAALKQGPDEEKVREASAKADWLREEAKKHGPSWGPMFKDAFLTIDAAYRSQAAKLGEVEKERAALAAFIDRCDGGRLKREIKLIEQLAALTKERDKWKDEAAGMGRVLSSGVVIKTEEYAALRAENQRKDEALNYLSDALVGEGDLWGWRGITDLHEFIAAALSQPAAPAKKEEPCFNDAAGWCSTHTRDSSECRTEKASPKPCDHQGINSCEVCMNWARQIPDSVAFPPCEECAGTKVVVWNTGEGDLTDPCPRCAPPPSKEGA